MGKSCAEMILLHIAKNMRNYEDRWPLTQYGISQGTKIDRTYVSKLLKDLISEGYVEVKKERLKGSKRKINTYHLTSLGWEKVRTLENLNVDGKENAMLKGKINVIFDENYAFQIISSNCDFDKTLIVTIKNPVLLQHRYGLMTEYIWLTYQSSMYSFSPDRLEFDVRSFIDDFFRNDKGKYLVIHGIEYLIEKYGLNKIEDFITDISKTFENIKIILIINDPNSPIKELGDWFLEASTVIQNPVSKVVDKLSPKKCSLIITDKNREEAKKIYGVENIISLKDDMSPESLLFDGIDYIARNRPCSVHIDCVDYINRYLEDRTLDFFKDLIDLMSKMGGIVEVKKSSTVFNSSLKFLFEDLGFKHDWIFVDREDELNVLKELAEDTKIGKGHTVLISGPAGIGKTSVVETFLKDAVLQGFKVFKGKAYMTYTETYLPYKEALNEILEDVFYPPSTDEELIDVKRRNSMFYDIAKKIEEFSKETPVIIFIDDIQWMDPSSLGLMFYLSSRLSNKKVLFIYVFRDDEITDDLKTTLAAMKRYRFTTSIKLHPLEWKNAREMICKIVGVSSVPESFVDFIYSSTLGNPLFIKELVQKLIDDGKIDPKKGTFKNFKNYDVPTIIKDIIYRKIYSLNPIERKIVEIVSVYGKETPLKIIENIMKIDFLELAEKIEKLIQSGFLKEGKNSATIALSHPLIGSILYRDMSNIKKKALHLKIAETIEKIYSEDLRNFYGELAHHYSLGDIKEKAMKYHTLMGDESLKNYAYERAIYHYKEALKIKELATLHIKIGNAKKIMSEYKDAIDEYLKALKLTKEKSVKGDILIKIALVLEAEGNFKDALKYVEDALNISGDLDSLSFQALGLKGWLLMRLGNYASAEKIFVSLLNISKSKGDKKILSNAYHFIGTLKMYSGAYDDAIKYLKKALSLRKMIKDEVGIISTLNNLGLTYKKMEDYQNALNYYKKSMQFSEKIGYISGIATALVNMGVIYKNLGKIEMGIDAYIRGLELGKKIDDKYLISAVHTNLGYLYLVLKDLNLAKYHFENSIKIKEKLGDIHGLVLALNGLGDTLRETHEVDKAIDLHKRALKLADTAKNTEGFINAIISLIEDEIEQGKLNKNTISMFQEISDKNISSSLRAEIIRISGFIKIIEDDHSGLVDLENGAAKISKSGNLIEEGIYYLKVGKFLIKKNFKDKGEKYLYKAAKIFKKLDMKKRYEEVLMLLNS